MEIWDLVYLGLIYLLIAAGMDAGATFKFSRIRKGGGSKEAERRRIRTGLFQASLCQKVFLRLSLRSKLAAHGAVIKKDFTLNMSYEVAVPVAPFEGQVYHCPIIVVFKDKKDLSVPGREYVWLSRVKIPLRVTL